MMPHTIEINMARQLVVVKVTGRLTREDYEDFGPIIEKQIRHYGKLRLLFIMHEFEGWTAGAMWSDIKFDVKHFRDIERLAIVGETKWQEMMAGFCKPFTSAKIQYFSSDRIEDAEAWVLGESVT